MATRDTKAFQRSNLLHRNYEDGLVPSICMIT
jgi:hypothetical protein